MANLFGSVRHTIDTKKWIRAVIIILLLVSEVVVGLGGHLPLPFPLSPTLAMLAPLALCSTLLFFVHFEAGLVTTAASFLLPSLTVISYGGANLGVMPFLVILLFGVYVLKGAVSERRISLAAPGMWPLLLLVVESALSVIFSYILYDPKVGLGRAWGQGHRWIGYQIVGILLFVYAGMTYLITARGILSRKWLWAIYVCAMAVCALVVISPLPAYLQGLGSIRAIFEGGQRLTESSQGAAAMILALLTLAMLLYDDRPVHRLALLLLFALAMLNLVVSYFLNTWLGFLAGAAVITWKRSSRTLLLYILLVLVLLVLGWEIVGLIQEQRFQAGSGDLRRLDIWRSALQTWARSPVLGVGNTNLASYTIAYGPFPAEWVALGLANPHNTYVGVLAENGVLGLGCFLWLIVAYLRHMWRSVDQIEDPRLRGLALGCLAFFVASTVTAFFAQGILPLYTAGGAANLNGAGYTWIIFGLGVAATRIGKCAQA